jgi:CheY-like chemotaxis protein
MRSQHLAEVLADCLTHSSQEAIASSASGFEIDRQSRLEASANNFLSEPIQADTLLALLEAHLNLEWLYEPTKF